MKWIKLYETDKITSQLSSDKVYVHCSCSTSVGKDRGDTADRALLGLWS
jgi:hypothetical protein